MSGETAISSKIADILSDLGFMHQRNPCGRLKVRGGWVYGAPNGTPDRLVLLDGGSVVWVEVKKPGGVLSQAQLDWHREARERWGHRVEVADNAQDAISAVLDAANEAKRRAA